MQPSSHNAPSRLSFLIAFTYQGFSPPRKTQFPILCNPPLSHTFCMHVHYDTAVQCAQTGMPSVWPPHVCVMWCELRVTPILSSLLDLQLGT